MIKYQLEKKLLVTSSFIIRLVGNSVVISIVVISIEVIATFDTFSLVINIELVINIILDFVGKFVFNTLVN
jgi:hypothetical protein